MLGASFVAHVMTPNLRRFATSLSDKNRIAREPKKEKGLSHQPQISRKSRRQERRSRAPRLNASCLRELVVQSPRFAEFRTTATTSKLWVLPNGRIEPLHEWHYRWLLANKETVRQFGKGLRNCPWRCERDFVMRQPDIGGC